LAVNDDSEFPIFVEAYSCLENPVAFFFSFQNLVQLHSSLQLDLRYGITNIKEKLLL